MRSISLLTLLILATLVYAQADTRPFSDIQDSRHREAITLLHSRGLISGFPDGTFRPGQAMTRAEFLAMVLRAAGHDRAAVGGQCLASFQQDAWFATPMCQGLGLGLIGGEPQDSRPHNTVTYAEGLKMVLLAFGFQIADGEDTWYLPYVEFAAESGIVTVLEYRPPDFVTREVAASILYRTMLKAGDDPLSAPVARPDPEPVTEPLAESRPVPSWQEPLPMPSPDPQVGSCAPGSVPPAPSSLLVDGRTRSLLTHLPATLGDGRAHPLVVAFHGRTNSNAQVQSYMRLDASAGDAIIVYPAGLPAGGGAHNWNDPGDSAGDLRDYRLFDAILAEFSDLYCIDQEKIFVVGHSLGAYFANSVACARADVIRAVASVAGGILPGECREGVAALLLHNPNDTLVAIAEGERARDVFLAANGLDGVPPVAQNNAFNCVVYGAALSPDPVSWCPHTVDRPYGDRYDPHSWPPAIGPYVMDFFDSF